MHHTICEERISIFIGANALVQFIGDVILESLGLIPPRINHLALTFLNAFISFKSLSAIHKDKFRFLHEDCQIFWVLELLLILGDIYYSATDDWGKEFLLLRLFFIACSTFNWVFTTYIIIKYKLYHLTYQGQIADNEEDGDRDEDECDASETDEENVSINIVEWDQDDSMADTIVITKDGGGESSLSNNNDVNV